MKNKLCLIALSVIFGLNVCAQELLEPTIVFSKQKTSYVTLQNGNEIEGSFADLDLKKGLISVVKIKDESGKKDNLEASSVKFMYLPQSGIDKFNKAASFVHDTQKWNNKSINQGFIDKGYIYFETVDVQMKKKSEPRLMQLLNPTFSKKVKIYYDGGGNDTGTTSIGGIKVAGGHAKSYYIKLEGEPAAYLLTKKDYEKEFASIWKKCSSLSETTDINWKDLTNDIIKYTECE